MINGCNLDWKDVISRVQQGSVLVPILFIICIKCVVNVFEIISCGFLNDTKSCGAASNANEFR